MYILYIYNTYMLYILYIYIIYIQHTHISIQYIIYIYIYINFMAPSYGWFSTASRLHSHYDEI